MRIRSVTVRNYRVHRELTIHFDDSRTLIGGPNECGKSTLVEALHRALFLKAKVSGDAQKSMVSTLFAGAPEVVVAFTAGEREYLLAKRFSGGNGTTTLAAVGGATWHGEEAEARLASLLKVQALGGGRGVGERLFQQWSHLWVWQGCAGDDPSAHANLQKDGLLQRLQQTGGAAALQSEMDSRIAAQFAAARETIFTQAGKPKSGSELDKAENEANQAETNRQLASERVERLRDAVRDFEESTRTSARAAEDLNKLAQQKDEVDARLSRVEELSRQAAAQAAEATTTATRYQALKQLDEQIAALRLKAQKLEASLQPKKEQARNLASRFEEARFRSDEAAQAHDRAANRTRILRLRRDLAAAIAGRFEKDARLQELLAKDSQVRGLQDQLARLREQLAKQPEMTAARLKKLQKLESEVNQSEAALNAMAAGIEVVSATEPVRVGEALLAAGQSQIVTERTEIAVGELLRLRISPGGGTSLQEARNRAQESRRQLQEELDGLGVATVSDAAEVLARRKELSAQIENTEAALERLDASSLPGILAEAREASAAAVAEIARRTTQVGDFSPPATAADAKQLFAADERAVEQAESDEAQSKALRDATAKILAASEEAISSHRQATDRENAELADLQAQLRLLLETHGDDNTRAAALAQTLAAKTSAEAVLSNTQKAVDELQPDRLKDDLQRLKRALDFAAATKRDAETKRAVAQAALRSDGADDPEAALALALARVRAAHDHLASVRRKAEAVRLLDQLFLDEQRALAEQFTRPFAEKISSYLQCLFGAGARATVTLADNAFTGLQLVRPTVAGGATAFDNLSGGAREQVAAAVRLAMAEVLAADHDGCLPLVFDDAFAYSDAERVQSLQRMLDLAASRGLQLIILTCTPSDYAALGARQVQLCPERATSANPQMMATPGSGELPGQSSDTRTI